MTRPVIALTTDFGPSSPYVAQMKGVILSALPDARIVDVTHVIQPQSIRHAEVQLRGAAFYMPAGTVHLIVVDPGVGTDRRALAVSARGMTFVGPDNGVLGLAVKEPDARTVVLDRKELFRDNVSATFHGRDIFAPVAAELAGGLALESVGTPISDPLPTTLPEPQIESNRVRGVALVADHFGNLLTNIPASAVGPEWTTAVNDRSTRWVRTYGDGSLGELLALAGSDGFLEIAMRQASAHALFERGVDTDPDVEVVCTRK